MIYCLFCFHSTFSRWHTKVLADTPLPVIIRHFKNSQTIRNKKDVGVLSLRAYPCVQAVALPLSKDKQRRSLPTPSDIYTLRHGLPYEYGHTGTRIHHMPTSDYIYAKRVHPSVWSTPYYIYKGNDSRRRI